MKRRASLREQRGELRRFLRESGVGQASIASVLRHTRDGVMLWPGRPGSASHLGGAAVPPRGESRPRSPTEASCTS